MSRKPLADDLANHFTAANGLPREWRATARCSGLARSDSPMAQAWNLRTPRESIWVDGHCYKGAELIDFALQTCEICPAQWDCASFAAACEDFYSTYSMLGSDMKWLVRSERATEIIEAAREANVSMQRAVALAREHDDMVSPCPPSAPQPSPTAATKSKRSSEVKSTGTASPQPPKSSSPNGTRHRAA